MPNASVHDIIKDPSRLRGMFGTSPILIGDIQVDVLEEETPQMEWDLPTRRVDVGFDVTDSRYKRPIGVILDCIFLDPDVSVAGALAAAAGFGWQRATWREKRDALYALAEKNELITIITMSDVDYSDMMIESIIPNLTQPRMNGFWFRLIARKVNIVSSEIRGIDASLIPDSLKPEKNGTSAKRKAKAKKPEDRNPVEPPKDRKSMLTRIVDGIGGVFKS